MMLGIPSTYSPIRVKIELTVKSEIMIIFTIKSSPSIIFKTLYNRLFLPDWTTYMKLIIC